MNMKRQNNVGTDYYYNVKSRNKNTRTIRLILVVVAVILAIVLTAVSVVFVMYLNGKKGMLNNDVVISTPQEEIEADIDIEDDGKTVVYNNKKYVFNENVTTVLFMGIDKTDVDKTSAIIGKNGQADALYLAVIDTQNGKTSFLSVSRDTITDVSLYSQTGNYVGVKKLPICAAFAYGDGKATSCENTATALSRLFYGMPINRYVTFDMSAVSTLTNYVGGVEVPEYNSSFTEQTGNKITVRGKAALKYVRYRDKKVFASNNSRIERQRYFLKSLGNKILTSTKKDIGYPLKIFNVLKPDMVTSLSASDVTFLASVIVKSNDEPDFVSIEGRMVEGAEYDEFYVDHTKLYEQVLELFYMEQ